MRAYSLDLRRRVVAAVDAGTPRAEVARTFQVSLATIKRYRKQRRDTGLLQARTSPGRTPAITAAELPALAMQLAAQPDATLEQQCRSWRAAHGQVVSASAMRRAIKRLDWTRKKLGR
jgi:transposase